jgi:hypothetical protein
MSRPIVLDNKRRASFGSDFRPGDTFVRSVDGNRVVFEKVEVVEAPLVKPRRTKEGWLMMPRKFDRARLVAAIRADRDAR